MIVYALGVISIFLSYQSKKREVAAFLDELHQLLESDDFDINMDLILIRKKKQGDDWKFSTPYTLLDLEYNAEDVVNRLKELKVEEYAETKIDTDDINPPILFVFGKDIKGIWTVKDGTYYVTIKYDDEEFKGVFCDMKDEAGTKCMTFSAVGKNKSLWGVKYYK